MFNEVKKTNNISLVFLKSLNVNVFPCGRRRSSLIEKSGETSYYIPFDPEAKLNTEANNIKHSSLNGLSQTYIRYWDTDRLSLVIGGYLFDIKQNLDLETAEPTVSDVLTAFGNTILSKLETNNGSSIYANIILEDVPLYSGFSEYNTIILRDQSDQEGDKPSTNIDLLNNDARTIFADTTASAQKIELNKTENIINYFYFAGLSFSTEPLTATKSLPVDMNSSVTEVTESGQQLVSLRILDRKDTGWELHQPALLPKVEHGDVENSVKFDTVQVDNIITAATINASTINQSGGSVPTLALVDTGETDENKEAIYQLSFSKVSILDKPT